MAPNEKIIEIIQTIFPNIVKEGYIYKTTCVELYIKDTFMNVAKINKCDQIAGNETIKNIIKLGHLLKEHIGVTQINLTDTSLIYLDGDCPINMSIYFILATGQSWYNRFGFKSNEFDTEFQHNSIIRSWTIKEYCKIGLLRSNKLKLDLNVNISSQKKDKIMEQITIKSDLYAREYEQEFFKEFPELDPSASIGSIFSYIKKNNILFNCVDTKNILLVKLINANFYLLEYEEDLVYKL